ncbi:hypothetical protein SBADM41S_03292 [Streptomyces badius]
MPAWPQQFLHVLGEGEGERARKMREIYLVHAENWVVETDGRVVALLGLLDAEIGGLFRGPGGTGHRGGPAPGRARGGAARLLDP